MVSAPGSDRLDFGVGEASGDPIHDSGRTPARPERLHCRDDFGRISAGER
jgi:hypothetical protein